MILQWIQWKPIMAAAPGARHRRTPWQGVGLR
jgi:hypothetical protein